MHPRPSGIVTLLTDYGWSDPYVGIVKGALLRASSKLVIVDVTHDVPPHDVATGAFLAGALIDRFPAGTVHVAVVDPGVGTPRRLLAVAARGCYWLAPDNGLLSAVIAAGGADVRAIDDEHLGLVAESRTFHGRDLLAPAAAWLAGGRYGFSALGPRIADAVALPADGGAHRIVYVDRFGNLVTNVDARSFADAAGIRAAGRIVSRHGTYGEAPPGGLLAYVGSFGVVEIAKNGGSAARELAAGAGTRIELVDR